MMIATTGEMPVNYAVVVDCDLGRRVQAGLTDKVALRLDQSTLELARDLGRVLNSGMSLEQQFAIEDFDLVGWHQEPDFIPGTIVRGVVLGPPDFSDVPDGIDWG